MLRRTAYCPPVDVHSLVTGSLLHHQCWRLCWQIAMLHGRRYENPQTANLVNILSDAATIREILAGINRKRLDGTQKQLDEIQKVSLVETFGTCAVVNLLYLIEEFLVSSSAFFL